MSDNLTFYDVLRAEARAEDKIRDILIALEDETHRLVDWVRVDTRRFAGCAVEICLAKARGEDHSHEGK